MASFLKWVAHKVYVYDNTVSNWYVFFKFICVKICSIILQPEIEIKEEKFEPAHSSQNKTNDGDGGFLCPPNNMGKLRNSCTDV